MSYQALLFCQDEKTARTVTQVLSELEFQVDPCTETFGAVKKLASQTFEAVVVDCQNEENASLLLKAARNSVGNQTSLMVALVEGQAGVAAAFRIGANLVLTKPIAIEQARSTLRVARGLLRKSAGTPASPSTTPAAPIPASTPLPAPLAAPAGSVPLPAARAAAIPATTPALLAPAIAPRPIPPAPRTGPVPPSALRAVASSSQLQQEAEIQPTPDAASAGLLEALDSKPMGFTEFEHKPLDAPQFQSLSSSAPEIVSVSEVATGAHQAVRAALAPKAPISSQDFGGFSAAAAAPAREVPKPAAPVMSSQVADLFEAPVFSQTSAPTLSTPEPTNDAELSFLAPSIAGRSKSPFIAAVALLALAAATYFGWTQLHKPAAATTPVAGPLQPPPPDFGAADAAPTPAPARTAAAPTAANQTPAESINRFSHASKPAAPVASDSVTTPLAVVPARATSASAPMQVKTELPHSAPATNPAAQDTADAPAISSLGASAAPDALKSIASSAAAALPTAPSTQRISQGVSEGLLLKRVQPVYPAQAMQTHTQGKVVLQATIAKDGSVRGVKVVSGPPILARAATDAVRQWKYKPYLLNGDPVEVQTEININFVPPR